MSIIGSGHALLLASEAAAAPVVTGISRSLRFNSGDSAYLNRTPSTAGNRKTWTWAAWVKRGSLSHQYLFSVSTGANNDSGWNGIVLTPTANIRFQGWFTIYAQTNAVYRDTSAWYHVVVALDSTQATSSDRIKIYINGIEQSLGTSNVTLNQDYVVNINSPHWLGSDRGTGGYVNGYLADVHFVDGQALDPTSFGEFDATTGVWNPIEFDQSTVESFIFAQLASGVSSSGSSSITLTNNGSATFGSAGTNSFGITNAIEFNGSSQWLSFSSAPNQSGRNFSVDFYVKFDTIAAEAYAIDLDGCSFGIRDDSGYKFVVHSENAAGSYAGLKSLSAADTDWHHIRMDGSVPNGLWIDGSQQDLSGAYVRTPGNGSGTAYIGRQSDGSNYFDGKLAYFRLMSTAIGAPSGSTVQAVNSENYPTTSAVFGLNGFHLPFSDNSGTTSTTLGKDAAGSNNWTPNNFSVASGSGNDSLVDVPQNGDQTDTGAGGEVRGNYATLNPLFKTGAGTPAYSNGNLDLSAGGSGDSYFAGTFLFSTGKYYYEATINAVGNGVLIGVCRESDSTSSSNIGSYRNTGVIYNLDATTQTSGSTYTTGDVIGVAIDCDNGEVQFYKNGVSQGATPSFTFTAGTNLIVRGRSNSTGVSLSYNFGARAFSSSAPSGFKALCTANLPTPTIEDGSAYMDVVLYSGNSSTQTISGLGFSPDFIWLKCRNSALSHTLHDTIRGVQLEIYSNSASQEYPQSNGITAFNSDGFTLGSQNYYNGSGNTFVAWTWDAGSSTVSNTDGSITSQVRASASSGFSIVTWTGTGSGGSIGHGLNATPSFIICKNRSSANNWVCQHTSTGTQYTLLNSTQQAYSDANIWSSAAGSSTIAVGNGGTVNRLNDNYVAYCFAPVAGYSAFGSYTGNGSSDGPFVYTGMRPRWVMIKNITTAQSWAILDTARSDANAADDRLAANLSNAESTSSVFSVDVLSNGFKLRATDNEFNQSGSTFVYACFSENPFKYARAR